MFARFVIFCLCVSCSHSVLAYGESSAARHYHRRTRHIKRTGHESAQSQHLTQKKYLHEHRSFLSPLCTVFTSPEFRNEWSCSQFLAKIEQETHSQISLDCSILPQRFYPTKGVGTVVSTEQPVFQFLFTPSLSCQLYNSPTAGTGVFNFSYTLARYWKNSAQNANTILGIAGGINDYSTRTNTLSQLTFSQTFPGDLLTVTLGQYSLYDIDGTNYNNDQQTGFLSYALSQNATASYSSGSCGAYLQLTPTPSINIQAGFQDAYNITGTSFSLENLTRDKYNTYGSISWSPQLDMGAGQYSALVYSTRSVPGQLSQTMGWSLNFGQSIGETLYIFGRWNGVTGAATNFSRSYVIGCVLENPLNRNPQDLLGCSWALSKVNTRVITSPNAKHEGVLEALVTLGCGPHFSITPDFQLYMNPARRTNTHTERVYSVRLNCSA